MQTIQQSRSKPSVEKSPKSESKVMQVDPDRLLRSDENPIPKYFINYIVASLALLVTVPTAYTVNLFGYFTWTGEPWQVTLQSGVVINGIVCLVLTIIFGRAKLPSRR